MKLSEFAYLTDENIHPDTVAFLRSRGLDVVEARACGLAGADDAEILRVAFEAGRVVLTHDSDCGRLAIAAGQPIKGILYLRPGHSQAKLTVEALAAALDADLNLRPPFIVVVVRRPGAVRIRLRLL